MLCYCERSEAISYQQVGGCFGGKAPPRNDYGDNMIANKQEGRGNDFSR